MQDVGGTCAGCRRNRCRMQVEQVQDAGGTGAGGRWNRCRV